MKRVLGCLAILMSATTAQAVDYLDAKVTGIGIVAGEDKIRFTIDKDPNVIFTAEINNWRSQKIRLKPAARSGSSSTN